MAIQQFKEKIKKDKISIVVAGGVVANKSIRKNLQELSDEMKLNVIFPDLRLCGDNLAMIAWAGIKRYKKFN